MQIHAAVCKVSHIFLDKYMKGPDFSWTINFIVRFEYLSLPQNVIEIYIMYIPYTYPKILMIIRFCGFHGF